MQFFEQQKQKIWIQICFFVIPIAEYKSLQVHGKQIARHYSKLIGS